MARIPWTKFQDFYLRLGYLKVLVASVSAQRRSTPNDAIVRRLETPLFDAADEHTALWESVRERMTWYPKTTADGRTINSPAVDEALLVHGGCNSLLYGITRSTAYKIVDWGHNLDFIGRGNQITERGLLLRTLMRSEDPEGFLQGDVLAWNPFLLSLEERLFFLYHLADVDRVTLEIIDSLASWPRDTVVETGDAARMTCRALFKVLADAESTVDLRDAASFRIARQLSCVIAAELDLSDLLQQCRGTATRRRPKVVKPSARKNALVRGHATGGREHTSKTKKNADHQTIPRFEQLVDLGFLTKIAADGGVDDAALLAGRRRWRYVPTRACAEWGKARRKRANTNDLFQWNGFAAAATAALHDAPVTTPPRRTADQIGAYLWRAYERVRRPVGHTPFDSVAVVATILAAVDGTAIEMIDSHNLMIALKKSGSLSDHVFFASGNALDKMFVQMKPGFVEGLKTVNADSNIWES